MPHLPWLRSIPRCSCSFTPPLTCRGHPMLMSPLHPALPSTIIAAALLCASPRPVWHCFLLDTSPIRADEGRELERFTGAQVPRAPQLCSRPPDGHLLQDTGMWSSCGAVCADQAAGQCLSSSRQRCDSPCAVWTEGNAQSPSYWHCPPEPCP